MVRPRIIDPSDKKNVTVVLGVRFSPRQMRALRKTAKARGMTVTELVRFGALQVLNTEQVA